ncbi:LIM domain protein [Ancylostoma caninum]|uniref:LIM domain protein n=1 Tax=Ancylostoma caninum TaxID=29170 RepID=A0A368GU60_ANCCA|nr:LIM domain protein [Ancylostoma caninum]
MVSFHERNDRGKLASCWHGFSFTSACLRDMTADEAPKDCAVCGKTVYPVERIFANKQLYHNQCFKCAKCEKKLTQTCGNSAAEC